MQNEDLELIAELTLKNQRSIKRLWTLNFTVLVVVGGALFYLYSAVQILLALVM